MLATGSLLAAALLPLRLLLLIALIATDVAGTLEKNPLQLLLCPQKHGPAGRGNTMALKDERSPKHMFPEVSYKKLAIYVSRGCPGCHQLLHHRSMSLGSGLVQGTCLVLVTEMKICIGS